MGSKVFTYQYKVPFDIVLLEGSRINLPMYRRDIKLYKHVTNKIDFNLRDADRKAIKLLDRNLKVVFVNRDTAEAVLTKYAEIVDEIKGEYVIRLGVGDTINWQPGIYTFTVIFEEPDGTEQVLFTDLDQEAIGIIEFINKHLPDLVPSVEIEADDFKDLAQDGFFSTGRYEGDARKCFQDGLHTAAIYLTDYTGRFYVQGSLEEYPDQDNQYFDIAIGVGTDYLDLTGFTGIQYVNFEGNYPWIRFRHEPDGGNTGTVDKVLYKN